MLLTEMLRQADVLDVRIQQDVDVRSISYDSRLVEPSGMFVAIAGETLDGNRFVPDAVAAGAVAVVSEQPHGNTQSGASWIQVTDARRALAQLSCAFYGQPGRRMKLVGITGTNGKTTTAFLVEAILRRHFGSAAMIGTIVNRFGDREVHLERTTPESPEINRLLAEALKQGVRSAVMEASSHALELKRVFGLEFDVAVFTNLTRDHLDFHRTFEAYFAAKKKLFLPESGKPPLAVINADDRWGQQLASEIPGRVLRYSLLRTDVEVCATRMDHCATGLELRLSTPAGDLAVSSPLFGLPNAYNLTAAAGVGVALGIPGATIGAALAGVSAIPGRLESVPTGRDFLLFVDFAHSDDALKNLLTLARPLTRGRLIVVFGCGGDRDRTKRPVMGKIAGELADVSILTSDNPRSEDPAAILRQIESGIRPGGGHYVVEIDRRTAIAQAISMARTGDVVLLAGKGHEEYQVIGGTKLPFSDRAVAEELLKHV
ncbi:MAG: UDP-N-acetylmuramoyl-L-alanyl-D-glutamate--2,6-diaminopimelate ligase [Acidobacteriota bacterium]